MGRLVGEIEKIIQKKKKSNNISHKVTQVYLASFGWLLKIVSCILLYWFEKKLALEICTISSRILNH